MTDHVTDTYNQECEAGNHALLHAMSSARFPEKFRAAYGHRLLPRPLFMAESRLRGMASDVAALFDVLTTVPQRLFDGDLGRYCEAVGIDPARAAVLKRFPGTPTLYGRADLYHDGGSLNMLEFNLGSSLGGTDRCEVSRALLEVDAFREFAEEHRLRYVHTGERVAQAFRKATAHLTGGADPVVAFMEHDDGLAPSLQYVLSFQEMMARLGIEVVLGEVSQVKRERGRLFLHGRPIDLVLRYFTENEIVDGTAPADAVEPIFQAHADGEVVLWTTLQSRLFNKGSLALLADPRLRATLSPDEAALVDRVLPWTRSLVDGPVEADGVTVDLIEYCREQRERLILKPKANFAGSGIVVGWKTTDADWKESLMTGAERGYIVQRRVEPRREPVVDPATGQLGYWNATWDCFLTPDGYAGSHIRTVPAGGSGVIALGAKGARTTGIFLYPDDEIGH